jgi:hypothetical protein
VLGNAMTEVLSKARKVLDTTVKRLVACASATLQPVKVRRIMRVWSADDVLLIPVSKVSNNLPSGRNLTFETARFAKDSDIMLPRWEWSIYMM